MAISCEIGERRVSVQFSYPITNFRDWFIVIGHLYCARVNQVYLNGPFFYVSLLFQTDRKSLTFSVRIKSTYVFTSNFVFDAIK